MAEENFILRTLENMFGNGEDYDKEIKIPETNRFVWNTLLRNYNYIYDLFKVDTSSKESENESIEIIGKNYDKLEEIIYKLNNGFRNINSQLKGQINSKEIYAKQVKITEDSIKSELLNNSNTGIINDIYSILYLIIYYSFFIGDDIYSDFINKDEIYTYDLITGDEIAYHFEESNRFFDFMRIINPNWLLQGTIIYSSDPEDLELKNILVKGYYKKGDDYHILFKEEKEIIDFIIQLLLDPERFNYSFNGFQIGFDKTALNSLSERVIQLFKNNVKWYEQTKLGEDSVESLCDGEITFAIKSGNEYSTRYADLFEYGFAIAKNYIQVLAEDGLDSKSIAKNDYINRILNTLIGVDKNLKFKASYETEYFDTGKHIGEHNTINGIFNYWEIKTGKKIESDKDARAFNFNKSDLDLESINEKGEKEIPAAAVFCKPKTFLNEVKNYYNNEININKNRSNSGLTRKYNYDIPLQFYELAVYNNKNYTKENLRLDKSLLMKQIDNFCRISGSVLSKLSFFCVFKEPETIGSAIYDTGVDIGILKTPSYKLEKKYSFENDVVNINDTTYSKYEDIYSTLGKLALEIINDLINSVVKAQTYEKAKENLEVSAAAYDEYLVSRFANGYYTEKDYFYIDDGNKKRVPVNSFVDVEFNVPQCYINNGKIEVTTAWLPVSSVSSGEVKEGFSVFSAKGIDDDGKEKLESQLFAGTYFDSFELEDKAGAKEITLTLKSSNDMNLERIIYSSLSLDNQIKIIQNNGNNILSGIDSILKSAEANFRIRFGYRDKSLKDANNNETAISAEEVSDNDFINRVNTPKPVRTYPWTYFKITGIESSIKDGEDRYVIKGVSSGTYMLNSMTLCGISANFSRDNTAGNEEFFGSPKNVAGKLAKWLFQASSDNDENNKRKLETARLCFLGDTKGTIITDFNTGTEKFKTEYEYKLKNGDGRTFEGGNLESIENFFYDGTKSNKLLAKNFNIKNDTKTLSIKEILDSLSKWLPDRVYYIGKSGNDTIAIHLPYEEIYKIPDFFNTCPYKSEKLKYQVIEADACIFEKGKTPSSDFRKTYFIRMYYEGPGRTIAKSQVESVLKGGTIDYVYNPNGENYLRIYNYRSLSNQVIEDIELSSNNAEFGNTVSSVTMLGCGAPIVFQFDINSGKLSDDCCSATNGEKFSANKIESTTTTKVGQFSSYFDTSESKTNPRIVFNNSNYIVTNTVDASNDFDVIASACKNEAALFFSSMQNKLYTGEMTIMGDPFYYFDSSLEAGKYEIYLQMNRVENKNSYKMTESRYTGIYYITGIKHSIDSDGKYTTTLSITKRIFGKNK